MPRYRVPVKTVFTEVFIVEAENAEAAMLVAIEATENGDAPISESESDAAVWYHEIREAE